MEMQSWVGGRFGTKEFNFLWHSRSGKDPTVLKEDREIKSAELREGLNMVGEE